MATEIKLFDTSVQKEKLYTPIQSRAGLRIPLDGDFPSVTQRILNQDINPYADFISTERVTYQSNDLCNLGCEGCFVGQWLEREGRVYVQNRQKVVPWEDFVGHLAALGPELNEFFLLGAEATMTPDLSRRMLEFARDQGLNIMAITNGAARDEIVDRTFLALGPNALHKLNISIDSMDAKTHDTLRGKKGALAATLRTVDRYTELGLPIKAQMTIWPKSYGTILDSVRDLYENHGVRKFAFHCGSIEGVTNPEDRGLSHMHPVAWRAMVEMLYQFRQEHLTGDDALTEFNIPYITFTEAEMRKYIIGDDTLADTYFRHVGEVDAGSTAPMPFVGCPAAGHENGRPPQVYLYGNDGPQNEGELSVCQIHSTGHPGMHYARYERSSQRFLINLEPSTSQMKSIKDSPHFCPAMRGATGSHSDRVETEKGPMYFGCRYPSLGQVPYIEGQFTERDYRKYLEIYSAQAI